MLQGLLNEAAKRMATKRTLLEQMDANPAAGWKMKDIETLCNQVGLSLKPPAHGSHYKVLSDILHGAPTVPYRRPIKAVYIKEIVSFAKAHIAARESRGTEG